MGLSYKEIFDEMKQILVQAFDNVLYIDKRRTSQIQLDFDDCYIGIVDEKDCNGYPAVVLGLEICDWDAEFWTKPHFQLKLTPFNCYLERTNGPTCWGGPVGDYSGYDKELTIVWRGILKEKYPAWEEAFKQYVWGVRDLKVDKAQREYDDILEKANNEYHEEIDSLNV